MSVLFFHSWGGGSSCILHNRHQQCWVLFVDASQKQLQIMNESYFTFCHVALGRMSVMESSIV